MPNVFPGDVAWSLQPSGPFVSVNAGELQARVYQQTGHVELAGPDLAGHALANVVRLAPPAIKTAHGAASIGALISSTPVARGLELKQTLGAAVITSRLTFPHEGVMHYEVMDWATSAPTATAVAAAASRDEHVYGFGEKFNAFDQLGKRVRILTLDDPGTKQDHSYKVAPWFVSTRGCISSHQRRACSTWARRCPTATSSRISFRHCDSISCTDPSSRVS